jgi:uncharacterized protein YndB with AHSA1/START domain
MKTALMMDFSVDKTNNTISVKREFAADLSLVWDAYTKSEILDQWWAPKPWKTKTKSMDFREGGQWIYAMVGPKGEEHWCIANYKKIEPQKSFIAKDGFADADGNVNTAMPQSTWNASFNNAEVGTLVSFKIQYDDLAQLEATINMGFKEGLSMAMENLDELLASQTK